MFTQQLINGIMASGIYALYAVGFTMIFGIMGVLNMAHTDFGTAGAFAVVWALGAGLGIFPAVVLALVVSMVMALLLERLALTPARRLTGEATVEMPLIATIGIGLILQSALGFLFGNKVSAFPWGMPSFASVGGYLFSTGLLLSAAIAVVVLAACEILVNKTDFGRQMRAVAQNLDAAKIVGINTTFVIGLIVGLSTLLAVLAGALVGVSYGFVSPLMGVAYAIKGLCAMIIGGVGSLRGAVIGALIIGVTESLAVGYIGSQIRDVVVFVVLIFVLLVRPNGLYKQASKR